MKKTTMTKRQAIDLFRQMVLPRIKLNYETDGVADYPARREAWNNFTDALCREGRITLKQYEGWTAPQECNRRSGNGR